MKLAIEQVDQIRRVIDRGNVTIETLRDDLVDHLCCVVEIDMSKGEKFETAFERALQEIAPEGLEEIQRQTLFLLNSTKIVNMKRIMYVIGLLSASASSMGICFKLLHLRGADPLLTYGLLAFTLLFLPLFAIDRFKTNLSAMPSERLKLLLGLVSALLTGLAIVLRLFLIGGAGVELLFIGGAAIFSFGFLPFLFFTMYKKSLAS